MFDNIQVTTALGFSTSVAVAAEELTEKLMVYLKDEDPDRNTVKKDALEVIQNSEVDGYALARILEDTGWEPDSVLVSLLEGVYHIRHKAVQKATKAWVSEFNIIPPYPFENVYRAI